MTQGGAGKRRGRVESIHPDSITVPIEYTDNHTGILVIGEAPGAEEQRTGTPFVGRSGHILRSAFERIGVQPEWITNLLCWQPPANRDPTSQEIDACLREHNTQYGMTCTHD